MLYSSDNIQWNSDPNPAISITPFKEYSHPHGPSFALPTSILTLFTLLFTGELVDTIVEETNRYVQFCLQEKYETWEKITEEEMYAYFGFLILMGMVNLPSIKDYWRKDEVFNYRPISNKISRTRFLDIHRFLHFVNNECLPSYGETGYSKIQKVKPVLTYLSLKCHELFIPGRDLSVDEAMVKYKGRSSIKQYMLKKPIKRGFNIWMIADADTGYVLKFNVYEGKCGNTIQKGLAANVVMNLTENYYCRYHHIFFDNYFTSIDLMLNLLRRGTYSCGTMRSDRKGFSTTLKQLVKTGLPSRGDHQSVRNANLSVVVWQDTKPISCCSTNSLGTTTSISRKRKDGSNITITCPDEIVNYNSKMGGVDRNDQLRGYYNIEIKSRKYYKYLFYAALDVAIINSYILSKFFPSLKQKNLKEFRVQLANELIGQYNSRKRRGRPCHYQPVKGFNRSHFPTKAAKTGNRCHFCIKYRCTRRETVWECKDCNLYFCHTGKDDDCFFVYHSQYGQPSTTE